MKKRPRKRGQLISAARDMVGAGKEKIVVSPAEYQAIKAGAIGKTDLVKILNNCNLESLREQATPKSQKKSLSAAQESLIIARARAGLDRTGQYSASALAERMGVSVKTIYNVVNDAGIKLSEQNQSGNSDV